MTVPPKWRERRDAIKAAMPHVSSVQGDVNPALESKRITRDLALNTTVPPEHVSSLDFLAVDRGLHGRGLAGEYYPGMKLIKLANAYGDNTRSRGKQAEFRETLVHEIGHHADHMLNPDQFTNATSGRAEAVAENYSEKHAGRQDSGYDRKVHMGDALNRKYMGGLQGVQDYRSYRGAGKMPGETISDDEMFGKAPDWTPAAMKFADRMKRGK